MSLLPSLRFPGALGALLALVACQAGSVTSVVPAPASSAAHAGAPAASSGVANVDAAVNQSVNFADWGISGGFSAMPLTQLLALHPQLASYQQAFVHAAAQASPAIPPQLLVAICLQESSGGLDLSGYGGPFQFSDDSAWAAYGPPGADRNDMASAAIGAANYIAAELKAKKGDLNAALRAYNGPIANGGKPTYQAEIQRWMQGELVYGAGA